jgi:hypothetical protein
MMADQRPMRVNRRDEYELFVVCSISLKVLPLNIVMTPYSTKLLLLP